MVARGRPDPRLSDVLLLCVGVGGLLLCVTLVFLAMRAVMDIGGACADGGPYVSAQSCPDGATTALLLGVFAGFGFGFLGSWAGDRVGGYGWIPILGWTALFATLGWNFLEYGLFDPPEGEGIVWGWLIPGILFQIMAWAPIVLGIMAIRSMRGTPGTAADRPEVVAQPLSGPSQRTSPAGKTYEPGFNRPPPVPAAHRVEVVGPVRREELTEIDALMGALIVDAAADAPVDPDLRAGGAVAATVDAAPASDPSFSEGTQALLDRLERLADLRDRGLLATDEYETAKEAVMRELETRS